MGARFLTVKTGMNTRGLAEVLMESLPVFN